MGTLQLPNGQTITSEQAREFYANGGDDNQFAQQVGITDPWLRREYILQARQLAGAGTMGGDSGVQTYFNRYKQYNPNGKYANDFSGWVNDQGEHTISAMRAGTFTGTPSSPSDWAPGGVYNTGHDHSFEQSRNGTGAHGTGDGWSPWSGVAGEAVAQPRATRTPAFDQRWFRNVQEPVQNVLNGGGNQQQFTPYWGGSPWWANWGGGNSGNIGYPTGQYAWGQRQVQPGTTSPAMASWPNYPGSGVRYSSPQSGGQTGDSGGRMYGDYTNGW